MKVLVVYAHPDPSSYVGSLRNLVCNIALGAEHELREHDLYEENFSSSLSANEWSLHYSPPEAKPHLLGHFNDLKWCDTLVFVYPTWWGGQPAIMKAWFDRVLAHGVAWNLPDGAKRIRPQLQNVKRIIAVTTHGSSKWVNTLEGEPGKRIITRSLRVLCSWRASVTWLAIYGVDTSTRVERDRFTRQVERRLQKVLRRRVERQPKSQATTT
jgi:putative NADPH-quinone reductase